jgi:hypothetical protein
MTEPTLNQKSNLLDYLLRKVDHYGIYDFDDFYKIIESKTISQFWYLKALVYSDKYFEAKKLLDSFGFKHKL